MGRGLRDQGQGVKGQGINRIKIIHVRELITSINVIITCHNHELRFIISIQMEMGKVELMKEERREKEEKGTFFKNLQYVCVPTPQNDCKWHVLKTCTNKK